MAATIHDPYGVSLGVNERPAVQSHDRTIIAKVVRMTDANGKICEACLTETDVDVLVTLLRA